MSEFISFYRKNYKFLGKNKEIVIKFQLRNNQTDFTSYVEFVLRNQDIEEYYQLSIIDAPINRPLVDKFGLLYDRVALKKLEDNSYKHIAKCYIPAYLTNRGSIEDIIKNLLVMEKA